MSWEVTGAAAVVQVAGRSRYLSRGDRIPEEADEASVAHLAAVGLIGEVEAAEPEVEAEAAEPEVEIVAAPVADTEPAAEEGEKPKPSPRKR